MRAKAKGNEVLILLYTTLMSFWPALIPTPVVYLFLVTLDCISVDCDTHGLQAKLSSVSLPSFDSMLVSKVKSRFLWPQHSPT